MEGERALEVRLGVIVAESDGFEVQVEQRFFLAELLVEQGLARIYTKGAALPGQVNEYIFKKTLYKLESSSKAAQRGGWHH